MVLSSNWGICGVGDLSATMEKVGEDVSDCLSGSSNYSKSTKLAKMLKKSCFVNLTAFYPLKLTVLLNLAPLYF
jgi:3-deoxy-D-arabino-heptulosonate 7-phosphate (DAHP) synthase class II